MEYFQEDLECFLRGGMPPWLGGLKRLASFNLSQASWAVNSTQKKMPEAPNLMSPSSTTSGKLRKKPTRISFFPFFFYKNFFLEKIRSSDDAMRKK